MKFIITGSGGCFCPPKPLCQCNVCIQAREKGYPYSRCGVSLFLEDIALLVDTPEDISVAINNCNIKNINHIMYSHADPDHTLGMRIMEQLRLDWQDFYDSIKPDNPITVYAQKDVMGEINGLRTHQGSMLDYYESLGLIKRCVVDKPFFINDIKITLTTVSNNRAVTGFVFESMGKKLVYAPCDCNPMPFCEEFKNADVLIVGDTYIDIKLKNGKTISQDHPLSTEFQSIEQLLCYTDKMKIKSVIITHIEEIWGKSYDDYIELEKQYSNLKFAYDNMIIEL